MSAVDINPDNLQRYWEHVQNKRRNNSLTLCGQGHEHCSLIWGGTCTEEVRSLLRQRGILTIE